MSYVGGYRMSSRKNDVVVRPKRQMTLPREICDQLGIGPGDTLELVVEESVLRATPRKRKALDAIDEIRETFRRYGVTEGDLLDEGRKTRQEIARGRRAAKK
jgi:AbrB family looped-hinge helix DNA binding protein